MLKSVVYAGEYRLCWIVSFILESIVNSGEYPLC
jgi:hypothetical protein